MEIEQIIFSSISYSAARVIIYKYSFFIFIVDISSFSYYTMILYFYCLFFVGTRILLPRSAKRAYLLRKGTILFSCYFGR